MADNTQAELVDVLLVEDDPGDALIVREAFEHHKIRNTLHVVTDGEQALRFVRPCGCPAPDPRLHAA
jgi:CheY-like chemotaxis protein